MPIGCLAPSGTAEKPLLAAPGRAGGSTAMQVTGDLIYSTPPSKSFQEGDREGGAGREFLA